MEALHAGTTALNTILGSDAEHLVLLLDSLPEDLLRLLAFERLWDEERRRLDADYWEPLPP